MRRFSQRNSLVTLNDINITPLLDLAFVLLIIFIITTPLLEKGLDLQLPGGVGHPDRPLNRKDIHVVEVSSVGYFVLDHHQMNLDQASRTLEEEYRSNPRMLVFIRADENGKYKLVADILDRCERIGITNISLRADSKIEMSRQQKKCFIVSTAFHGLLLLVILFGTALMPAEEDLSSYQPINVYSSSTVSDLVSKGGDPEAVAAPAAPVASAVPAPAAIPTPVPEVTPKPEPVKPTPEAVKPPKPEREVAPPKPEPHLDPIKPRIDPTKSARVEPPKIVKPKITPTEETQTTPPKTRKSNIDPKDLQRVDRTANDAKAQVDDANKTAEARARDARRRAAQRFASDMRSLKSNLSSDTLIQTAPGVGGGGEVSVNYKEIVYNKFNNAWVMPATLDDETPNVTVKITIARNGQVISAHIVKSSGNRVMDNSITKVLENVTFIEPFPEGSSDSERTFNLIFNVQSKRQTG